MRFLIKAVAFVFFTLLAAYAWGKLVEFFPAIAQDDGVGAVAVPVLWLVLAGALVKLLVTRPLDRLWPETYRTLPPGYGKRSLDQQMLGWHFRNRPRR